MSVWKAFYKVEDEFTVRFSSQNHVNMLVTTEQTRVMNEVGFCKVRYIQKNVARP